MSNTLLYLPVDELICDPNQPRRAWVQSELDRLVTSIKARGILQPLRVVRDEERKCWRIVTGESRWRAAKQALLDTVPCLLVEGELSETEILADQLIENSCRHDLRPLDFARGLSKLKKLMGGCTSQDLATELGISGASVTRAEALLKLPDDIQGMVDDGRLAESAASEIARLPDHNGMRVLASIAVTTGMKRKEIVEAVQEQVGKKSGTPKPGKVTGKLDGVSFSFLFSTGQATPETLLRAIEHIRSKLKALPKGEPQDVSLSDVLKAS